MSTSGSPDLNAKVKRFLELLLEDGPESEQSSASVVGESIKPPSGPGSAPRPVPVPTRPGGNKTRSETTESSETTEGSETSENSEDSESSEDSEASENTQNSEDSEKSETSEDTEDSENTEASENTEDDEAPPRQPERPFDPSIRVMRALLGVDPSLEEWGTLVNVASSMYPSAIRRLTDGGQA